MRTVYVYRGAFGNLEVPHDIYQRSVRWRESRPNYMDEWAEWQYEKIRLFGGAA